ncbi:MAG: hypothetical protein AAF329_05710 [Cyanobacteria bacterium P01_A01_bin.17]
MLIRRLKRFLRRVTPLTWAIWVLLAADLLEPGYLKFNFLVARIDASVIGTEIQKIFNAATESSDRTVEVNQ